MKSEDIIKTGKKDHDDTLSLKTATKTNPDNSGVIKRFLKWLSNGAKQSRKSGACRT